MNAYNRKKVAKLVRVVIPTYLTSFIKPRILWAHLYVTRKCNLSCSYCVVTKYPAYSNPQKKDLKLDEMKEVIDHLYRLGCRFISFFGGEPTIRKDLTDLIRYANQKPMMTHITSNGSLLTEDYIQKLADANIDIINLSVDSVSRFDASRKDFVRSKEVFHRLLEGRSKYGFELNVNAVLTPMNLEEIIPIVKHMCTHKVPISIGFVNDDTYSNAPQWDFEAQDFLASQVGKTTPKDHMVAPFRAADNRARLFSVLDELKQLKREHRWIIEPETYFDDIRKFVEGSLKDWDCGAGENYISVDSDGKIQLCASSPTENIHISALGNDFQDTLAAMRDRRMHKGTDSVPACKTLCLSNCLYDVTYFLKRPYRFFKEMVP